MKNPKNGTARLPGQETEQSESMSPSEFITSHVDEFIVKNGRSPAVILISQDVLKDLYEELKHSGLLPKDKEVYSVALMLRQQISMAGVEVAIVGGTKRFGLL